MAKRAIVILAPGFEEIEAVTPIDVLRRANIEVKVAGIGSDLIKGARGVTYMADTLLSNIDYMQYDALIIPGGMPGSSNIAASTKATEVITFMNDQNKLIAALCAAPAVVLAPLGILNNKQATCYPGCEADFNRSTTHRTDNVVVDGNIITSKGAGTALDFSLEIVKHLVSEETANTLSKALVYK